MAQEGTEAYYEERIGYYKSKGMPPSFVVTHDWPAIIGEVVDTVEDDEVRLPYPDSMFFMTISGYRVCVTAIQDDGEKMLVAVMYVLLPNGSKRLNPNIKFSILAQPPRCECGTLSAFGIIGRRCKKCGTQVTVGRPAAMVGPNHPPILYSECVRQIKAACIAMDTGLVKVRPQDDEITTEYREAVSKVSSLPIPKDSFRVLDLLVPKTSSIAKEHQGGTKRLHYRRGHWRHYPDHVTWIKWMLVGNPEAGTVEKTYKL